MSLIFGRTLRLLPYVICANSEGSGETARMQRLAWSFPGRLCDKYHNLMSWLVSSVATTFSSNFRHKLFQNPSSGFMAANRWFVSSNCRSNDSCSRRQVSGWSRGLQEPMGFDDKERAARWRRNLRMPSGVTWQDHATTGYFDCFR